MAIVSETVKELAENLTEFEVSSGVISVDEQNDEESAVDRFQQRLQRFGTVAPEAKKISRALRFGTTHEAIDGTAKKRRLERFGVIPHSAEDEQQKKRKRIDRFHLVNPTATGNEEAKKKRIDRFGPITSSTTSTKPALSDAIKKRAERFGDVSQVAKVHSLSERRINRAQRFKLINNA